MDWYRTYANAMTTYEDGVSVIVGQDALHRLVFEQTSLVNLRKGQVVVVFQP